MCARPLQAKTAVSAWLLLLRGRFRLLERFSEYVAGSTKAVVVTEDTWRQVGVLRGGAQTSRGSSWSSEGTHRWGGWGGGRRLAWLTQQGCVCVC
jgi:hypothetical protein